MICIISYFTETSSIMLVLKICKCSFVFKTIIVFVSWEHYIIRSSYDINVHSHKICSLTGNPNYPPLLSSQSSYHVMLIMITLFFRYQYCFTNDDLISKFYSKIFQCLPCFPFLISTVKSFQNKTSL